MQKLTKNKNNYAKLVFLASENNRFNQMVKLVKSCYSINKNLFD